MSASTTSTCRPCVKARSSATVSAIRGVRIRSITGSSAVLSSSTSSPARRPLLQHRADHLGVRVGQPHGGEDDAERLAARGRLGRDLRGQLEVRQPGDGEDRQLLAADQGGERVDRRDAGEHRLGGRLAVRGVERAARPPARVAAARTGGPPSIGSPRPLQTRPSQPGPTGTRSGRPENATRVPPVPSRRCPRAPARRRGPGRPPAPARAARRLAVSSRHGPWRTRPSRRRSPRGPPAAGRAAPRPRVGRSRGRRGRSPRRPSSQACSSVRSIRVPAGQTSSTSSGGVSSRGPQQRGEVDLLDLGGEHPAVDQRGAGVDHREHRVDQRGGLLGRAVRVVRGRGRSAGAPPRAAAARRAAPPARWPGQRRRCRRARRGRPAGPPRRAASIRARRGPQPGSPWRAYQTASASASRENDRSSRRPGSAGRRRGRGPGTTAPRTNRSVCAVTGSVMSPPGGETAPMIVTDASSPPSVTNRPARS